MPGEIYMAAAAAMAYEKRLEVIANNLANVNTAGFKRDEVSFQAYLTSAEGQAQAVQPPYQTPQAGSSFWISYESRTDFSPGPLKMTGNPLDVALNGKGFFSVESPSGTVYTRRGNFTVSSEGALVTQEGWPVQGEGGGEVRIEGRNGGPNGVEVSIGKDGTVQVNGRQVGRLNVEDFPQAGSLVRTEKGYFQTAGGAAGEPVEDISVAQGYLEMANVDAVHGMVEMIEILRGYESYQRVIRAVDEVNAKSISEVGRTT
jgi:flagellar basal-body rod protein FlgF